MSKMPKKLYVETEGGSDPYYGFSHDEFTPNISYYHADVVNRLVEFVKLVAESHSMWKEVAKERLAEFQEIR